MACPPRCPGQWGGWADRVRRVKVHTRSRSRTLGEPWEASSWFLHQPHGSQRSISTPQSPDLHRPLQEPMATRGESKIRCAVSVKCTLDFRDLVWKENVKYLNNFLYWLYVEMKMFWIFQLNILLKLISSVSFYFFNAVTKTFGIPYVTCMCGSR